VSKDRVPPRVVRGIEAQIRQDVEAGGERQDFFFFFIGHKKSPFRICEKKVEGVVSAGRNSPGRLFGFLSRGVGEKIEKQNSPGRFGRIRPEMASPVGDSGPETVPVDSHPGSACLTVSSSVDRRFLPEHQRWGRRPDVKFIPVGCEDDREFRKNVVIKENGTHENKNTTEPRSRQARRRKSAIGKSAGSPLTFRIRPITFGKGFSSGMTSG